MNSSVQQAHSAIERFLKSSQKPAIQDPGEKLLALDEGRYALQLRGDALTIEAWDDETNLVRRVTGIKDESSGRLDLIVERFGKRSGVVSLVDLARGGQETIERRSARLSFRERFRRFLRRQYPEWKLAELSTEPDLQHSLSPAYPRALLRRGRSALAAIGAPASGEADGVLTFGLIWLDYLRQRDPHTPVQGLAVFVPCPRAKNTCLRLRHLDSNAAEYTVFAHSEDGVEERIDSRDYGNVDTRLEVCAGASILHAKPTPEGRLETLLRDQPEVVYAALQRTPIYGQVPAFSGVDRGILDLLAVDRTGRLVVIELKASEDLQLPMQALDYWLRVKWHAERGEFARFGYFPGSALRSDAPRLLLVAPALKFHPTSEIVLRYFSPEIAVERVGLAQPWENGLRVMFRAPGAQSPQM